MEGFVVQTTGRLLHPPAPCILSLPGRGNSGGTERLTRCHRLYSGASNADPLRRGVGRAAAPVRSEPTSLVEGGSETRQPWTTACYRRVLTGVPLKHESEYGYSAVKW